MPTTDAGTGREWVSEDGQVFYIARSTNDYISSGRTIKKWSTNVRHRTLSPDRQIDIL